MMLLLNAISGEFTTGLCILDLSTERIEKCLALMREDPDIMTIETNWYGLVVMPWSSRDTELREILSSATHIRQVSDRMDRIKFLSKWAAWTVGCRIHRIRPEEFGGPETHVFQLGAIVFSPDHKEEVLVSLVYPVAKRGGDQ